MYGCVCNSQFPKNKIHVFSNISHSFTPVLDSFQSIFFRVFSRETSTWFEGIFCDINFNTKSFSSSVRRKRQSQYSCKTQICHFSGIFGNSGKRICNIGNFCWFLECPFNVFREQWNFSFFQYNTSAVMGCQKNIRSISAYHNQHFYFIYLLRTGSFSAEC